MIRKKTRKLFLSICVRRTKLKIDCPELSNQTESDNEVEEKTESEEFEAQNESHRTHQETQFKHQTEADKEVEEITLSEDLNHKMK